MSEQVNITLPKLGESILTATVVRWFKKVGDPVLLDEPLLEVSTDKVNSEIPSPVAGVLSAIYAEPHQEIAVGDLLATIEKSQGAPSLKTSAPVAAATSQNEFFSPALLRLAKEQGVPIEELSRIQGTGLEGRITKQDLERHLAKKAPCPLKAAAPTSLEGIERLKMSGMRKAIADNMVKSFYEAPHATLITEVDVTSTLKYIQAEKERFAATHGCKLTITSLVASALTRALQAFPLINASLEEDTIIVKKHIHIGIAVSVDQGLVVPVIRHCQQKDVPAIAKAISELSQKARSSKLTMEDLSEGTITITNFGMSGVQIGIPIIRYPEVAIVGMGAICKKVVPLEDDVLAVRSLMHISLTFDHRVLDGMYGCAFLNALKQEIESRG